MAHSQLSTGDIFGVRSNVRRVYLCEVCRGGKMVKRAISAHSIPRFSLALYAMSGILPHTCSISGDAKLEIAPAWTHS